jgi:hypothetical protein
MFEDIAFNKPQGSTFVVGIACNVVIYRWIWGREPISKLFSNLIACESD